MKYRIMRLMLVFAAMPLSAANVSFVIVETGLSETRPRPESSFIWEDGLMDVFFDAGHIVFNAPPIRLAGKPAPGLPRELQSELEQARTGGADFFVIVILEFPGGELEKPRLVVLRLFNVAAGTLLYETSFPGDLTISAKEELTAAKNNARKLVPRLGGYP